MVQKHGRLERPERVKLTLSLTLEDRKLLEEMANAEGVSMAALVHRWIRDAAKEVS